MWNRIVDFFTQVKDKNISVTWVETVQDYSKIISVKMFNGNLYEFKNVVAKNGCKKINETMYLSDRGWLGKFVRIEREANDY